MSPSSVKELWKNANVAGCLVHDKERERVRMESEEC